MDFHQIQISYYQENHHFDVALLALSLDRLETNNPVTKFPMLSLMIAPNTKISIEVNRPLS